MISLSATAFCIGFGFVIGRATAPRWPALEFLEARIREYATPTQETVND